MKVKVKKYNSLKKYIADTDGNDYDEVSIEPGLTVTMDKIKKEISAVKSTNRKDLINYRRNKHKEFVGYKIYDLTGKFKYKLHS